MCNPQIDHFDWIKMKGQLRLVLRIEHCSILNINNTLYLDCTHDKILYYNTSLMIHILLCVLAFRVLCCVELI